MKKQIALVLLLSTLISSLAEKQQSLLKRTDRKSGKHFVAEFREEKIPSLQIGSFIYDSKTNAVKIQEIKDFLILILNGIGFDYATAVQKINTSEVSLLMEAMDVCYSITKVDLTAIGKLKNILEIVTNSKIEVQRMDKAVDIIKGKLNPKSKLSDKQLLENSPKGNKEERSDEKPQIQENRQIFNGNKDDEENNKSLRKTNRSQNDEGLKVADALPFRISEKLLKEKLENNYGEIRNEIKNDELENPGFNKRINISETIIKKPTFRKESIKDSYQFISEEQLKNLESKSEEKNTPSNSESELLKIIKKLQSKIENLEQNLENFATIKNVENISGDLNNKLTSIESQSKSLAENLEKQSAQSKDLAEKLKNQSSELKDEISKNVTKYRVIHKTLTGNENNGKYRWSYRQAPTDFGVIGDFDINFEIFSEKGAVVLCNVAGHEYHNGSSGHVMVVFVLDRNTKGYQGAHETEGSYKYGAFYSNHVNPTWVSFSHFQTFLVSKGSHNISLYSNNKTNNFSVNGGAMQLTIIEN